MLHVDECPGAPVAAGAGRNGRYASGCNRSLRPSRYGPFPAVNAELPDLAEARPVFRRDLIAWFEAVARDLPWRRTRDPYRIWLSEVMLQQTRVEQARPYYERFVVAFPDVEALARADLDEVLRLWEGLGYYTRARSLHRAARMIVDAFDGRFPDTYEAARRLPGVGPYTAAAVLSLAYGRPHAVLDGNVARVLARVFTIPDDVKATATRRLLQALADALLDPERPGPFNEAMMELGATVCTPAAPRCPACPLRPLCGAFAEGRPDAYPVATKKAPVPHYDVAVGLVFDEHGRVLIQRRPADGLLGGLWEFPGGKREPGEPLEATCRRELREELGIEVDVGPLFHRLAHAYSHFRITLHAFPCRLRAGTPASRQGEPVRWVPVEALGEYAFPRANRRLIERLLHTRHAPTLFDAPG
ncbi:MAG: A/G-specific adenine glycosylase [Rhodothermaceae bacterium]|nr:MAG: A/G-specific adenine glycosylase [Rhodothermaceae bacterium]